ncbi:M48 family metalloprotease [Streptomyces sp. NBC_00996]|uniref:M48 family metalloprotease n=1 Tax=Streptomyces sp. NBC_00996 TaxID=2903710 RepID=UPI00386EE80D|nr:M48 family metalloprotease [Streptomyces sp. NBC_00996]
MLLLFMTQVPSLIGHTFGVGTGLGQFDGAHRGRFVTAMLSLTQFLPLFFLLAAVIAIFAPRMRCHFVERCYGLLPPDHPLMVPAARPTPAPGEVPEPHFHDRMKSFLNEYAPGTQLRLSTQSGLSARVYPSSWRGTRVGVFAPLVHLWETDVEAAQAVLLHELGHLRRGEQHVAGLASPFTTLVRVWPYVLAGMVALPVTLLFVIGDATARLTLAEVVLVLFSVPKVLLLVVAALWSAELGADRYAAEAVGPGTLVRALRRLEQGDRGGLARLYHPPVRVRIWFASRGESGRAQLLLTLLWPAALLAQLLLAMLGAMPAYVLLGASQDRATREVLSLAHDTLTTDPAWWATLAAVLVWPLATGVRSWAGGRPAFPVSPRVYATAALFPAVVLLVGLLPLTSRPAEDVFADGPDGRATASTGVPSHGGGSADGTSTACPSRSAPADPPRPPGLPSFTREDPAAPGGPAPHPADGPRTFRTLNVTSVESLSGSKVQAQDLGDRLRGARWTLHSDGSLSADVAGVPVLRSTRVSDTTRWLTGRRTERTDVSATTTWMEARLVLDTHQPPRLDVIRAAAQAMRAVVDCREFTSTSSTAQRLSLTLGEEP